MNSPIEPRGPECPDVTVLEEYVAQRAVRKASAPGDASALEDHLASCETCRTRKEELARETRDLTEWLALSVG
ncbi:MAG: hypothetical protein NTU83_08080, partial [Candidatus Hydrogenedentes bacterium]|nr:hypothetical protein [Candidatus Hydrogenedentota bacterium]